MAKTNARDRYEAWKENLLRELEKEGYSFDALLEFLEDSKARARTIPGAWMIKEAFLERIAPEVKDRFVEEIREEAMRDELARRNYRRYMTELIRVMYWLTVEDETIPTPEEVYVKQREFGLDYSRASVNKTFWLLRRLGLIR